MQSPDGVRPFTGWKENSFFRTSVIRVACLSQTISPAGIGDDGSEESPRSR